MAKKMPTPSPEQAEKVIETVVTKSLDAGLAGAKATGKALGLTPDQATAAYIKAVDAWAEKN